MCPFNQQRRAMKWTKAMVQGRWRFLLVGWAVLETMLFGGLINGWASLVFVLKEDGLYADLCYHGVSSSSSLNVTSNLTTTALQQLIDEVPQYSCTAQDGQLNLWFTIAAALRNIYAVVIGFHIFKFGTRSSRITGWFLFCVGALMMAFADESYPWLILPSLMTLSYGGVTLLLTNVQISCLFPHTAGVIVTLMSGAFDFSAATQMVVKMLYELGLVSRLYSFVGLACLHTVMVLISTLCFLPKDNMLAARPDDKTSPLPPPQLDLTKRRDSLYDWSAINVQPDHHRLRCSVCEDNSSYGEQREQLAMSHALNSWPCQQDNFAMEHLNENQCACEQFTTLSALHLNNLDIQAETSEVNKTDFSGKFDRKRSPNSPASNRPAPGHKERPLADNEDGVHNVNGKSHIFTIWNTQGKESPAINTTNVGGKFVSIVQVGSPQRRIWRLEASHLWRQGSLANEAETVAFSNAEHSAAVADNLKVHTSGRRKVTLDVCPQDHRHARDSSTLTDSDDAKDDRDAEGQHVESEEEETEELFPTLKSCLCSAVFWLHVLWFSINVLRIVAFFGLINTKLTDMFHGDKEKVSLFTDIQAYFMMAMMGICWTSGALYDWLSSVFKDRKEAFQRQVLPGATPLALTSLLGVAFSGCWMADGEAALYVMFALLVFYNPFIFGICMSFILRVFPEHYFGILNGLTAIIAGGFCFLQYAIFVWYESYSGGPPHADIFMLTLLLLSLIHPVYIVVRSRA